MPLRSRTRRLSIIAGALTLATIAIVILSTRDEVLRSSARRAWRDQAVAQIQQRYADKTWLAAEVARLRPRAATQPYNGGWVAEDLLLMKNGDWIVCRNVCTKERSTSVKKDLFIGLGSDGKWYYSTFHFCVGKCVLFMERQPDDLAQFVQGYWLKPFDGKSDESLNLTWTGGSYGVERLQAPPAPSPAR